MANDQTTGPSERPPASLEAAISDPSASAYAGADDAGSTASPAILESAAIAEAADVAPPAPVAEAVPGPEPVAVAAVAAPIAAAAETPVVATPVPAPATEPSLREILDPSVVLPSEAGAAVAETGRPSPGAPPAKPGGASVSASVSALTPASSLGGVFARLRRRAFWRSALLWASGAVAAFVVFSVLWVGLYGLVNPPGTLLMLQERWRLGAVEQRWRDLEDIAPEMRRAALAAEDAKFCAHWGVDLGEMRAAIREWRRGGRLRGASTISQQTAKNLFLWSERSWIRKGFEFWFTGLLELMWSKPRILEVYLNVAEFGPGVFGVEAAARRSFGVSASELTVGQAARLASVLPAPRIRDPRTIAETLGAKVRVVATGTQDLALDARADCVAPR